jgi:hypothetical protein
MSGGASDPSMTLPREDGVPLERAVLRRLRLALDLVADAVGCVSSRCRRPRPLATPASG